MMRYTYNDVQAVQYYIFVNKRNSKTYHNHEVLYNHSKYSSLYCNSIVNACYNSWKCNHVVDGNNSAYSLGSLIRCGRASSSVDDPVWCVSRV